LKELTKPDAPLALLNELAERRIIEAGATPAFKDYKPSWSPTPFPDALCTSVNYEVCHGRAGNKILREGDIVKYDLGVKYNGAYGDACITVGVGQVANREQRLMRYSLNALYEGIRQVKAGAHVCEIGRAIERYAGLMGYQVIKEYGGHGIGSELHMDPQILHYYDDKLPIDFLHAGQVICIEPMITPGKAIINIMSDGWTAYCTDGKPVGQYEHMILVTEEGSEILTSHV
jgi:methionyl aminopeptidase